MGLREKMRIIKYLFLLFLLVVLTYLFVKYLLVLEHRDVEEQEKTIIVEEIKEDTLKTIYLNELKAFPTAEGAGAIATGGRGGKVIYVSNRNASGEGSLSAALKEEGKRTIVFSVGGKFTRGENENFGTHGDLTIAGQTANDIGGVHLTNKERAKKSHYSFRGENFIMRYLTARGQWELFYYDKKRSSQFDMHNSNKAIIDHFSGGWGSKCMAFNKINPKNNIAGEFTFQRSLCIEGIGISLTENGKRVRGHNISFVTGFPMSNANKLFSDEDREEKWNQYGRAWDFHHNAFIMLDHRQPTNTSGGISSKFSLINNYTYGWRARLAKHGGNAQLDMINNVFEQAEYGKKIEASKLFKVGFTTPIKGAGDTFEFMPSIYVSGNKIYNMDGSLYLSPKSKRQFTLSYTYHDNTYNKINQPLEDKYERQVAQSDTEDGSRMYPVVVSSVETLKKNLLDNVGAGVRFNSDGTMKENDDSIDIKYITFAKEKDGYHKKSKSFGDDGVGDPKHFIKNDYKMMVPRDLETWDSDRDGMPNSWENEHGLNPNIPDNNGITKEFRMNQYKIINNASYTNLEIYLADIAGDFHMLAL